ncbi:hypothetical protein [Lentzea nigeriaca]|uniref:hypothetical protein n=1 Tax=Lentzea nigeriaca TaxID=1128665 RepID=UPI001956CD6E|nr:hypothetical protein [Lentzea nigeriaca]MBM7862486.1 hypothetical protein [Lentzea nigeriaca]
MPIEQQPGSVEPETQVMAKITTQQPEAATIPATTPVDMPAKAPAPAPARKPKSLTRRIARRILGPTLMTKK